MVQNGLALNELEADVCRIWEAVLGVAVDASVRASLENASFQLIPQRCYLVYFFLHEFASKFEGFANAGDVGHIFGAAPHPFLLMAANHVCFKLSAFAHIQCSNAFRRVHFVT